MIFIAEGVQRVRLSRSSFARETRKRFQSLSGPQIELYDRSILHVSSAFFDCFLPITHC